MKEQSTEIVVMGAGYAGILATVRLAGKLRKRRPLKPVNITLINASDVFVQRVRLHEFAANRTLKRSAIVDMLRGTGVGLVHGSVSGLDPARRVLTVEMPTETRHLRYDTLVYALGSVTGRDGVPGVHEHAYTLAPAGPLSAEALRENLPTLSERRGRLVVVGAGATGIESAAEFASNYPDLRVDLLTRGEFGGFIPDPKIADYMRKSLEALRITVRDNVTVTEVRESEIRTNKGSLPSDVVLWTGGFVALPLARDAGLAVNERGQILVDPYLRSISHPDILAVGDAAHPIEEPGVRVRMSAFTALVLGAHGADNLAATLQGREPRPLSFAYYGQGIALGHHNAIGFGVYPDDVPNRPYFIGRAGYETREFFVRVLAALPGYERRWPGIFFWTGKARYAKSRRLARRQAPVDSSL